MKRTFVVALAVATTAVLVGLVLGALNRRSPHRLSSPLRHGPAGTVVSGPSSTSTTTAPPALVAPPGADAAGQTTVEPSSSTETFHAEMVALWQAIQSGDPSGALPAFFPEQAYVQLKALGNNAADYQNRLVAHFELDIAAAHRLLGPDPVGARLVTVLVPSASATWIRPGACSNRLGYWHVPGARVVYEQGGVTRSFGIASLISWRGYWYVVHLGAVVPPAGQGTVDAPAAGTGSFTPVGGC